MIVRQRRSRLDFNGLIEMGMPGMHDARFVPVPVLVPLNVLYWITKLPPLFSYIANYESFLGPLFQ